jgi:hypothetical protein
MTKSVKRSHEFPSKKIQIIFIGRTKDEMVGPLYFTRAPTSRATQIGLSEQPIQISKKKKYGVT